MTHERLEALGKAVARVSDESASSRRVLADARRRLLERAWPSRSRHLATKLAVAVAVVCSLVLGLVAYRELGAPAPVTFEVASDARQSNEFVSALDEAHELRFSDGTRVELAAGTSARVVDATPRGAGIVVERGRARARVVHRGDSRWSVRAGPYGVRVTGTDFEVQWTPETGTFELVLHEGAVRVSGPGIDGQRELAGKQRLRLVVPAPAASAPRDAAARPAEAARPTAPSTDLAPEAASPLAVPSSDGGRQNTAARGRGWRELLSSGRPAEGLAALERRGTEQELSTASAKELWSVADAARLSHRPRLARRALLLLRSNHGTTGRSAFLLGKIAADQLSEPNEATRWFETYLRESPSGALAEQALGRLVELYGRLGSPAAQRTARRYLERYPDGAYADLARRTSKD